MARNPVSSSNESHWNERKSWPAVLKERYRMYKQISSSRSQPALSIPRSSNSATAAPAIAAACKNLSPCANQKMVGIDQWPRIPNVFETAAKYPPTGRMPRAPINPVTWTAREAKVVR